MPACITHQRLGWTACAVAVLAAPSYGSEVGAADDCPVNPPPNQRFQGPFQGGPYPTPWSGQTDGGGPFPPYAPYAGPGGSYYPPNQFGPEHQAPAAYQSQWFRRPYPYHLDYYRMRYGGSYAPYFGNIYGPSVLFFAPPYPYYGSPYFR